MSGPNRSPQWRLFLALWPDEGTRAAIAAWQDAWHWPPAARLVARERLHLTLHFIGNVAAERLPELASGLQVGFEPMLLRFREGQVWPGGIAVLRPDATPEPLLALHARLAEALVAHGLPVEERPFRPHVTLARKAGGAAAPAAAALQWRAQSGYVLARSVPNGGGYEVVARFAGAVSPR